MTPRAGADPDALGAWRLPDELADLAGTVRRFMDSEVRPLEDTLPHDTTGLPDDLLLPLQEKARRLGLWALNRLRNSAVRAWACSARPSWRKRRRSAGWAPTSRRSARSRATRRA